MVTSATPSSGINVGVDLDGVLKQKNSLGVVSPIGTGSGSNGTSGTSGVDGNFFGSSGSSGTSGSSGSSGTSGVVGSNGFDGSDGANSLRWLYGDYSTDGNFDLDDPQFELSNSIRINITNSYLVNVYNWISSLGLYASAYPGQVYLQITQVSSPDIFSIYYVNGATDYTTYFELNIQSFSSNGIATDGEVYSINWVALSTGSSGTSGTSGSIGPIGTSGTNGTSGTSGSSGTSGTSGTSGSSGSSGTSGMTGGILVYPRITTTSPLSILPSPNAVSEYFPVDTGGGFIYLFLPAGSSIENGKIVHIKDIGGSANTNNITISPSGTDEIDGVNSYTINSDYGSVTLIKDSAAPNGPWFIISKVTS
jgi:hypothetical protein